MRMMVEPREQEREGRRGDGGEYGSSRTGPGVVSARLRDEGSDDELLRPRGFLDDFEPTFVDRPLADAATTADVPYVSCFTGVRDGLLRVLAARDRSLEARLVAFMEIADRLSEYFDENSASVDVRQLATDLEPEEPLERSDDPRIVDVMIARVARFYFREYRARGERGLDRLVDQVRVTYGRPALAEWSALTEAEALAIYAGGTPGRPSRRSAASAPFTPSAPCWDDETLIRAYRRRRALLLLSHGRRVERAFTNYCLHHLLVEHYIDWPNLRAYARDLALRIASARFLLFSHPGISAAWELDGEGPESREVEGEAWSEQVVDRVLAETFRCVTRAAERGACLEELRRSTRVDESAGASGLVALVSL